MTDTWTRREYLRAGTLAGIATLAGCIGSGSGSGGGSGVLNDDTPTTSATGGASDETSTSSTTEATPTQTTTTIDPAVSAARESGTWQMFQADPANSGYAPHVSGPSGDVEAAWEFKTEGSIETTPAIDGDTVYVSSTDGVYALDLADGTEQWFVETGTAMEAPEIRWTGYQYQNRSSPAIVDGTVVVGTDDGNIYGLDATDGSERWRVATDSWVRASPTVVDSTVYITSADQVLALALDDGYERWRYQAKQTVWATPAVVNGSVYVADYNRRFYKLDAEDGTEQWNYAPGENYGGDFQGVWTAPTVRDGKIYSATESGISLALDADTGRRLWTAALKSGRNGIQIRSPAVVGDRHYLGTKRGRLYALDLGTLEYDWRQNVGKAVTGAPVITDDTLYVSTAGETAVRAYAIEDGTETWQFAVEDGIPASPVIADETVLFGTSEGAVYALR